ncbi:uncharacterized protein L969DRAFT_84240 [Mixia osmundae IAM 14324]|uniref:Galactose oxidase n=1 Tax=Mixia osmundae (strain CBS 9802 / IAM 14324 / JCM 22182 / KY 12970) TaxID=764103 RepID=G7E863_MIXOS|nr:uncharacterized protein L969DRAFT_84240 [Mixia osmundae IAM 14324]KEI42385.1 hypothetical protein L969DRAFT_84240 [Mixia osmundae IAM 14324]GAA99023.1 hypothetical protein E5Q_05712 [Mixia osmundae IAM 14324]
MRKRSRQLISGLVVSLCALPTSNAASTQIAFKANGHVLAASNPKAKIRTAQPLAVRLASTHNGATSHALNATAVDTADFVEPHRINDTQTPANNVSASSVLQDALGSAAMVDSWPMTANASHVQHDRPLTATTAKSRYGHSAVYLPSRQSLLLIGGEDEQGLITNEVTLLDLSKSYASAANASATLPFSPLTMANESTRGWEEGLTPHAFAAIALGEDERIYIVGGLTQDCNNDALIYSLDTSNASSSHTAASFAPQWQASIVSNTTYIPPRRRQNQAVALDGGKTVYVYGGIAEPYTCSLDRVGYLGIDIYHADNGTIESIPFELLSAPNVVSSASASSGDGATSVTHATMSSTALPQSVLVDQSRDASIIKDRTGLQASATEAATSSVTIRAAALKTPSVLPVLLKASKAKTEPNLKKFQEIVQANTLANSQAQYKPAISDYAAVSTPAQDAVVFIGGQAVDGTLESLQHLLVFNASSRDWTLMPVSGQAPEPRMGHVAVALPDKTVLVHGGLGSDEITMGDFHLLNMSNPSAWAWMPLTINQTLNDTFPALAWHTATLVSNATNAQGLHQIVFAYGVDTADVQRLELKSAEASVSQIVFLSGNAEQGWSYGSTFVPGQISPERRSTAEATAHASTATHVSHKALTTKARVPHHMTSSATSIVSVLPTTPPAVLSTAADEGPSSAPGNVLVTATDTDTVATATISSAPVVAAGTTTTTSSKVIAGTVGGLAMAGLLIGALVFATRRHYGQRLARRLSTSPFAFGQSVSAPDDRDRPPVSTLQFTRPSARRDLSSDSGLSVQKSMSADHPDTAVSPKTMGGAFNFASQLRRGSDQPWHVGEQKLNDSTSTRGESVDSYPYLGSVAIRSPPDKRISSFGGLRRTPSGTSAARAGLMHEVSLREEPVGGSPVSYAPRGWFESILGYAPPQQDRAVSAPMGTRREGLSKSMNNLAIPKIRIGMERTTSETSESTTGTAKTFVMPDWVPSWPLAASAPAVDRGKGALRVVNSPPKLAAATEARRPNRYL